MIQGFHIAGGNYVMCFVHQYQLEILRIEFHHSIPRGKTSDRGDCDIGSACSMGIAHFDIDGLVRVGIGAMASCLLDELPSVSENESLRGMTVGWFDPIDEVCEDNLKED